ncbi:hypothetical protein ACWDU9_09855 [Streptomyces cellulosae]
MILLPLFRDRHDNAQRTAELGYGVRLDPYRFTDAQLHGVIDRLLGDTDLRHAHRRRRDDPPARRAAHSRGPDRTGRRGLTRRRRAAAPCCGAGRPVRR